MNSPFDIDYYDDNSTPEQEEMLYNAYEAGEILGDTIKTITDRLMAKVKDNIKAELDRLRHENKCQSEQLQRYRAAELDFNKQKREFEAEKKSLKHEYDRKIASVTITDLLKASYAELYRIYSSSIYAEHKHISPHTGKEITESVTTGLKYRIETYPASKLHLEVNDPRYGIRPEKTKAYIEYRDRDADSYSSFIYKDENIAHSLEQALELETKKTWSIFFTDKAVAEEYCKYKQDKEDASHEK